MLVTPILVANPPKAAAKDKNSIRLRRKLATWKPAYFEKLLNVNMK
jgi:hypothetical protein